MSLALILAQKQQLLAIASKSSQTADSAQSAGRSNQDEASVLAAELRALKNRLGEVEKGLNGGVALSLEGTASENITATELNAGASGTVKRTFVTLLSVPWANFQPVVTPAASAADTDIVAPSVTGTPRFQAGRCIIEVVFDTDAGSTKTYAAADSVTCQVRVASDDKLLGWTVTSVTKTYTVT